MSYNDIYTALEAVILAAAGSTPVQLPNLFIDASDLDVFARVHHLPIEAVVATLGTGGQNERGGMTQVDVFIKAGNGTSSVPDDIVAAFPRGLGLGAGGEVYELMAYRDGGELVEDGWYQDRVIVKWKALTDF